MNLLQLSGIKQSIADALPGNCHAECFPNTKVLSGWLFAKEKKPLAFCNEQMLPMPTIASSMNLKTYEPAQKINLQSFRRCVSFGLKIFGPSKFLPQTIFLGELNFSQSIK